MQRKLFVSFVLCIFCAGGLMAGTYAQNQQMYYANYHYTSWKAMGGLSLGDVTYSRDPGLGIDNYMKKHTGYLFGIGYESSGKFGIEVDILYMQKGVNLVGSASDPSTNLSGSFDISAVINEVTLPVVLKIRILEGSTPYIFGGGEIAYIMSGHVNYTVTDASTSQTYSGSENVKDYDELATLDYGLVFGVGFELISGPVPLFIEGRYHSGLANLFKQTENTQGQSESNDWVRSRAIVIVGGIKF